MRIIACLICLLAGSYWSQAQSPFSITLGGAPNFSLHTARADADRTTPLFPNLGWEAHAHLNYQFTPRAGITTGIGWVHAQPREQILLENAFLNDTITRTRQFSYIRIPLMISYKTVPQKGWHFHAQFGPHFDINTRAHENDERVNWLTTTDPNGVTTLDVRRSSSSRTTTAQYNRVVFGVSLEIGAVYQLTEDLQLLALLHLSSSITSLTPLQSNNPATVQNAINRYWEDPNFSQLRSAGIRLGLTYQL